MTSDELFKKIDRRHILKLIGFILYEIFELIAFLTYLTFFETTYVFSIAYTLWIPFKHFYVYRQISKRIQYSNVLMYVKFERNLNLNKLYELKRENERTIESLEQTTFYSNTMKQELIDKRLQLLFDLNNDIEEYENMDLEKRVKELQDEIYGKTTKKGT